jgi:hypothetical protein
MRRDSALLRGDHEFREPCDGAVSCAPLVPSGDVQGRRVGPAALGPDRPRAGLHVAQRRTRSRCPCGTCRSSAGRRASRPSGICRRGSSPARCGSVDELVLRLLQLGEHEQAIEPVSVASRAADLASEILDRLDVLVAAAARGDDAQHVVGCVEGVSGGRLAVLVGAVLARPLGVVGAPAVQVGLVGAVDAVDARLAHRLRVGHGVRHVVVVLNNEVRRSAAAHYKQRDCADHVSPHRSPPCVSERRPLNRQLVATGLAKIHR